MKLASWFWRRFFFSIQTYVNMVFLIVAPPNPGDYDVNNSESILYQKSFHVNLTYFGSVVLERKILK
jgi:hypothetical protein